MKAEHCSMSGFEEKFVTSNTKKNTWPAKEWAITVCNKHGRAGPSSSRKLKKIQDLMQEDIVLRAKLTRCEVIAIVLYTGPMVSPKTCPML